MSSIEHNSPQIHGFQRYKAPRTTAPACATCCAPAVRMHDPNPSAWWTGSTCTSMTPCICVLAAGWRVRSGLRDLTARSTPINPTSSGLPRTLWRFACAVITPTTRRKNGLVDELLGRAKCFDTSRSLWLFQCDRRLSRRRPRPSRRMASRSAALSGGDCRRNCQSTALSARLSGHREDFPPSPRQHGGMQALQWAWTIPNGWKMCCSSQHAALLDAEHRLQRDRAAGHLRPILLNDADYYGQERHPTRGGRWRG